MPGAQKKVIVRRYTGELVWGYLPSGSFTRDGQVELMEIDGRSRLLKMEEIKWIAYVREFNNDDAVEPERLVRRSFSGRPRGDGLWLRLSFRDGDFLEGLAAVEMEFIDGLAEDRGIFLSPPDARSNATRMFVPRVALRNLTVLGYVTAPSKRTPRKPADSSQAGLFEE